MRRPLAHAIAKPTAKPQKLSLSYCQPVTNLSLQLCQEKVRCGLPIKEKRSGLLNPNIVKLVSCDVRYKSYVSEAPALIHIKKQ